MKKLFGSPKKIVVVAFAMLMLSPIPAFAQSRMYTADQTLTVLKSEKVDHDYFAARKRVVIEGTINGDAYVAGEEVDVNGTVNGDLIVAAGKVFVRGTVTQNIRGVGGDILIEGTVGRNVSMAGGTVTIDKGAKLNGNAVLAGGTVSVLSAVKDLTIAGSDISLSSAVSGDVLAAAGTLQLTSDALVRGNLNYWSDNQALIASGAAVTGKTTYNPTAIQKNLDESSRNTNKALSSIGAFFKSVSFLSALIFGFLFLKFLPVYSAKTQELIIEKLSRATFVGLLTVLVTPIVVILLMVTLIGIPFGITLAIGYCFVWYFSKLFVSMALGTYLTKVAKLKMSPYISFTLGFLIFTILGFIPVIGFVVKLVSLFAGVGAIVLMKKEYFATFREKKLI